jgi:7,8-dihydroneopterin aldolase/epimerase/oxygenase
VSVQSILINAKIEYDYNGEDFIDYANLCTFIENDLKEGCYLLLEDALQSLIQKIKLLHPSIQKIVLKIAKPDILPNALVSVKLKVKFKKN